MTKQEDSVTDYMRMIIYLKERKEGKEIPDGGFVRLEKRGTGIRFSFSLNGKNSTSAKAAYAVCEKGGVLFPVYLGMITPGIPGDWILERELQEVGLETVCGFVAGEEEHYWIGNRIGTNVRLNYEQIPFSQLQAAEETEEMETKKMDRFPVMYPFEDDEMDWCRQITPADFSYFPMDCWHYAKNSFLLQGFYNYRHLLYAHRKGKDYIAVPGQYHKKEQFLAGRFGFLEFKPTLQKKLTPGDFGYWLREMERKNDDR